MGLDYGTLNRKPIFKLKDKNGETQTCYDLLNNNTYGEVTPADQKIIINEYYVARPDLVSLAVYGTDEYADVICKVNGIANPFELNEDDMISVPDIDIVRFYTDSINGASELFTEDAVISKEKNTQQKEITKKRSPNEMTNGNSNFIIDRSLGLIFY